MAKIEAPDSSFNGEIGGVKFENGVAETDNVSVIGYAQSAGYKVSGKTLNPRPDVEIADPRDLDSEAVGTRLRDAAVDPRPEDFLAPVNAGEANPHGPEVVSPEIHASNGPAGVRPGVVHVDDHGKQEAREKAYAEARLIQQMPAGEAVASEVPDLDDRGPLDLSDPGSAEVGRQEAASDAEDEGDSEPKPARKRAAAKKS